MSGQLPRESPRLVGSALGGTSLEIGVAVGRAVHRSFQIRNDCGSLGASSWCAAFRERWGASN